MFILTVIHVINIFRPIMSNKINWDIFQLDSWLMGRRINLFIKKPSIGITHTHTQRAGSSADEPGF